MSTRLPKTWSRVVIERVIPEIDGGRFAAKAVQGETIVVRAEVFTDGHDKPSASATWTGAGDSAPTTVLMKPIGGDWFTAEFTPRNLGIAVFTVSAWVDGFRTWRSDFQRRIDASQDVRIDLLIGADLVRAALRNAKGEARARLETFASLLSDQSATAESRVSAAMNDDLAELMLLHGVRERAITYPKELEVTVERRRAQFSSWYELFPRSASPDPARHGTLRDVEALLPEIAETGFDVLYLPPVHPIGTTFRKGPNNSPNPGPGDPGSPWAIGSKEGGHKAIHSELGTLADFDALVRAAQRHELEIALDIAFQASPDHPYVAEHPEWFKKRPDGTIQYAENPPKKYQDIYPFDFECEAWPELWHELKSVFEFWIDHGVRIFRVDNPHTKPFRFWEWCIGELKSKHPDTIFLSEAFTRPAVMYHLAKLGFSQSYTYFPWRNTREELTSYARDLAEEPVVHFFRPNHWPNTPDILTAALQHGGRGAFACRLILAATLGTNYGIYGPPFETFEHRALREGSEEYLDSEKYQIRRWALGGENTLRPLITRVNRIRKEHAALQQPHGLYFHPTDNGQLLAYSKTTRDFGSRILCVVNLDSQWKQAGFVDVHIHALGLSSSSFEVHDLVTNARYTWQPGKNYVDLDPLSMPAHVFRIEQAPPLETKT